MSAVTDQIRTAIAGAVSQLAALAMATTADIEAQKVDLAAAQVKLDADNAAIAVDQTALDTLVSVQIQLTNVVDSVVG